MPPGFFLHPSLLYRDGRWLGYAACLVCAVGVAFGLFALMMLLIRTPRPPAHHRTFGVFLRKGSLQPHPRSPARVPLREHPPPLRTRPRSVALPAAAQPPIPRPLNMPTLPESSSLAQFPAMRIMSPAKRIEWRPGLEQYLRERRGQSLFSLPVLPTRRAPILGGATRLRLSGGAEIDRIGDRCYGVPSVESLPGTTGDPGYARFMQALQPLFAHRVPCPGTARDDLGESFLKALRRRIGGSP